MLFACKLLGGNSFCFETTFFLTLRCDFRQCSEDRNAHRFALFMAVNVIPCPTMWPGEEQPSLLDQEGSLMTRDPGSSDSVQVGDEQLINTRPPRSKSKGDLVIVINEKLKNSK